MDTVTEQKSALISETTLFWVVFALLLMPWLLISAQNTVHSDMLWLSQGALRLMSGASVSDAVFDPNPPLSILVYFPPALLYHLTGFPLDKSILIYSLLIVLVGARWSFLILDRWDFLNRSQTNMITAAYIAVNTILPFYYFGERDSYVGMALFPFILMQVALTFNLNPPRRLIWPVFALGAFMILLKPCFGLLPTILLAHRAIRRRTLSVIFHPDFLSLAIGVVTYAAVVVFFFPDFIEEVWPDLVRLYFFISGKPDILLQAALFMPLAAVLFMLSYVVFKCTKKRNLSCFFIFGGIVCFIGYASQDKGLFYQLIPIFPFFAASAAMIGTDITDRCRSWPIRQFSGLVILLLFAYHISPPNFMAARPSDYPGLRLSKLVTECRGQPDCSMMMFHVNMGIVHETAFYNNVPYVSRFPALWFLPALIYSRDYKERNNGTKLTDAEKKDVLGKYVTMIYEDIHTHRPSTIILVKLVPYGFEKNLLDLFSEHPDFRKELEENYVKAPDLILDYGMFFKGSSVDKGNIFIYDVYKRNGSRG